MDAMTEMVLQEEREIKYLTEYKGYTREQAIREIVKVRKAAQMAENQNFFQRGQNPPSTDDLLEVF
jgi:hypothetical protein